MKTVFKKWCPFFLSFLLFSISFFFLIIGVILWPVRVEKSKCIIVGDLVCTKYWQRWFNFINSVIQLNHMTLYYRSSGGPKGSQVEPHTLLGKKRKPMSWFSHGCHGQQHYSWARTHNNNGDSADDDRDTQDGGHTPNIRLTETYSLGLLCTSLILDIHVTCMTPVKTRNLLTSITWPYWGLKCTAHRGHVFFRSLPLTKCWFSIGSWAHVRFTCWKQGRIVQKPVNTSPGLKFSWIIVFSSIQIFFGDLFWVYGDYNARKQKTSPQSYKT